MGFRHAHQKAQREEAEAEAARINAELEAARISQKPVAADIPEDSLDHVVTDAEAGPDTGEQG